MLKCIKVETLNDRYGNKVFPTLGIWTTQDLANAVNKMCPAEINLDVVMEKFVSKAKAEGVHLTSNAVSKFQEYVMTILADKSIFKEVPCMRNDFQGRTWDVYKSIVSLMGKEMDCNPDEVAKHAWKVASVTVRYFEDMLKLELEKQSATD